MTLSRCPPDPTAVGSRSALPYNAYKTKSAQVLRPQLLEKPKTMKSKVSATLQEQKRLDKGHFDTKVKSMPKFQLGELVYVNKSPLATADHERMKPQAYNKLM